MAHRRPNPFLSRLPAFFVGSGLTLFAFYFIFLRPAKAPTAEAVPPAPVATVEPAPVATPAVTIEVVEETVLPAPEPKPAPAQDLAFEKFAAEGKLFEARAEIAILFKKEIGDAARAAIAEKAIEINQRLLMTRPDPRDIEIAEIMQGENPTTFCRRFKQLHGEYGLIQLLNNIRNVQTVRAGTHLRVPKGTWSIFVDKSLFTLYLCYQGTPFKAYRVCIGADDKTPAAEFVVGIKNPKPAWYAPPEWIEEEDEKNPVPYGHAKNPLGEYWIGIDHPLHHGFGIHGTNAPETIGTKASNGCVRMLNDDVVEIARIAWKGMNVTIVE